MTDAELDKLVEGVRVKAGPEIAMKYRQIIEKMRTAKSAGEQIAVWMEAKMLLKTAENKTKIGKQ